MCRNCGVERRSVKTLWHNLDPYLGGWYCIDEKACIERRNVAQRPPRPRTAR